MAARSPSRRSTSSSKVQPPPAPGPPCLALPPRCHIPATGRARPSPRRGRAQLAGAGCRPYCPAMPCPPRRHALLQCCPPSRWPTSPAWPPTAARPCCTAPRRTARRHPPSAGTRTGCLCPPTPRAAWPSGTPPTPWTPPRGSWEPCAWGPPLPCPHPLLPSRSSSPGALPTPATTPARQPTA